MNTVVAFDSYKGSISAIDACKKLSDTLRKGVPGAKVTELPIADGGEGTKEVLVNATDGRTVKVRVTGPRGDMVDAEYGVLGDGRTAVIEMAEASGLDLLRKEQYDPMVTTTFGTGQLIKDALDKGYKKIIITVGGSATNDGGLGAMTALGLVAKDSLGEPVGVGAFGVGQVAEIDVEPLRKLTKGVEFIVACDVKNPLLGESGCTRVFSPQKGADEMMMLVMEKNMTSYADAAAKAVGKDYRETPGAGAGGGMGFALMAFLGAKFVSGIELVAGLIKADGLIKNADLVITGEGQMDAQTLGGKAPFGILEIARKYGKKVIGICGIKGPGWKDLISAGFDDIISLAEMCGDSGYSFEHAGELLSDPKIIKLIIK